MKNILLPMGDSVYVTLTATRHHNNKYAWVVALRHGKEEQYLAYLIDSSGVNTTPVVNESTLKNTITGSALDGELGFIRISPDGQHFNRGCNSPVQVLAGAGEEVGGEPGILD
jgi:hypothetical protein